MNETQVRRIIREELASLLATDRYTFQKHLQLFDGRNVQVGRTTGTKIGTETTQKIGFHGKTPTVQGSAVASPSTSTVSDAGDTTNNATINANFTNIKTAIDDLRTRLSDKGLTA